MKVKMTVGRCCCSADDIVDPPIGPGYAICAAQGHPTSDSILGKFAAPNSALSNDIPLVVGPDLSNWSEMNTQAKYDDGSPSGQDAGIAIVGFIVDAGGGLGVSAFMKVGFGTSTNLDWNINGTTGTATVDALVDGELFELQLTRPTLTQVGQDYLTELYYKGNLIKSQVGTLSNTDINSDVAFCAASGYVGRHPTTANTIFYSDLIVAFT